MKKPDFSQAKKRTKEKPKIIVDGYLVPEQIKAIGKEKKYYLRTYGCQMNLRDSETIKAILEDLGYSLTDILDAADLILLNTCSIRENAHNKVFGFLGRIKPLKQAKPNLVTGICGCMAQEEIVIEKILNKYKWLDFVLGTHNIHTLPQVLNDYFSKKELAIDVWSEEGDIIENIPVKRDSKYKAWVNIMYGCDKFCTYCIVPYTRGKQRSRRPKDIIKEVKELVVNGFQEVTLLGQNVNAYGKDFNELKYNMEDLLRDISETGIKRIWFMTSHPWDFTDGMIKVIKENNSIMPYIHLPIQSGSDKVLKLMGRRYTKKSYLELYNKIKQEIPRVSITTDIIVGFPNETEEDFKETLEVVNTCKFAGAFTFIFSPRVGTPAAKIKDNNSLEEKRNRLKQLNQLVNKYTLEANEKLIGSIELVLIEGYSEKNKELLMGYTNTNKLVNVKGNIKYIGKVVNVKITNAKTWSMNGEIIDGEY